MSVISEAVFDLALADEYQALGVTGPKSGTDDGGRMKLAYNGDAVMFKTDLAVVNSVPMGGRDGAAEAQAFLDAGATRLQEGVIVVKDFMKLDFFHETAGEVYNDVRALVVFDEGPGSKVIVAGGRAMQWSRDVSRVGGEPNYTLFNDAPDGLWRMVMSINPVWAESSGPKEVWFRKTGTDIKLASAPDNRVVNFPAYHPADGDLQPVASKARGVMEKIR